jgi:hypothetical protein
MSNYYTILLHSHALLSANDSCLYSCLLLTVPFLHLFAEWFVNLLLVLFFDALPWLVFMHKSACLFICPLVKLVFLGELLVLPAVLFVGVYVRN